jgi:hypothetical protein
MLTVARAIQQFPPAVSAPLKERLSRGETATTTDVETLRIRKTANGIINPRRKSRAVPAGGSPDALPTAAPSAAPAQVAIAPTAVPQTGALPREQPCRGSLCIRDSPGRIMSQPSGWANQPP